MPFIYLYNGERGPNTKFSKYIFYIFYPVHIWILYIIATVIVTRSL
ncbi:TraX family protein [Anaerorhabdus sp.]|nr:TraX family protein [Anaerorhabdus sp.]MEA4876090.1 TraX family protein [Anaerorhabdus sp.]